MYGEVVPPNGVLRFDVSGTRHTYEYDFTQGCIEKVTRLIRAPAAKCCVVNVNFCRGAAWDCHMFANPVLQGKKSVE